MMPVCTIGSMAARILRENAFEVGIDPKFEVIDEAKASYLRAEATEQVLAHLETGADPLLRAVIDEFGLRGQGPFDKRLLEYSQEVVARVRAMPEGFEGLRLSEPTATPARLVRQALEAAREIQEVVKVWGKTNATDETFASDLEAGIDRAEQWLAADTGEGFLDARFEAGPFLEALLAFPPSSDKYRAKKPDADAFAAWRGAYASVFSEAQAALGARVSVAAVSLARLLEDAYARAKGNDRLDQGDLLRRCLDAFSAHPELSERYRERFKVIMVDEFQDTDKLQVAVIAALAQPGFANVCTVGDAQQSIYRFRGADVNVFFEYRDRLRSLSPEAEFPQLPHNFRSHGDVLSLVDAVFGQPQVFGDEFLHLEAAGAVNTAADLVFEGDGPARIAVSVFQNDGSRHRVFRGAVGSVRPRGGRALRAAEGGRRAPRGDGPAAGNDDPRLRLSGGAARCGLREHRDGRIGVRPERGGPTCGYAAARGGEPRRLRGALPGARLRSVRAFRRCSSRARHNGRLGVGKRRRRRR
ncbi:MAG: UvrD-helicase domain-containing protein [Adlercreutzia sp.]